MDNLVRISGDVFDIADRLKEIDGGYYPVYNLTKKRFEIHHENTRQSLQVVLPYKSLDKRALDKVRETRIEYALQKIKRMDEENELKRISEEKSKQSEMNERVKETFAQLKRS